MYAREAVPHGEKRPLACHDEAGVGPREGVDSHAPPRLQKTLPIRELFHQTSENPCDAAADDLIDQDLGIDFAQPSRRQLAGCNSAAAAPAPSSRSSQSCLDGFVVLLVAGVVHGTLIYYLT